MKNLLNQLEKVVTQVQNLPYNHPCDVQQNAVHTTTMDPLNTLLPGHKDCLLTRAAVYTSEKELEHQIKLYQSTLIRLLDSLHQMKSFCLKKPKCDSCLKRSSIQALIKLLWYMRQQFHFVFDQDMKLPEPVFEMHRTKLSQALNEIQNPLINKSCNPLLLNTVTHPIADFLKHKKEQYTFNDINYLELWMAELVCLTQLPHTNRELSKMICCSAISYNLNSVNCFYYFTTYMRREYKSQKTISEQLETLHYYRRCLHQVFIASYVGYNSNQESLQTALSNWLVQEIDYIHSSYPPNTKPVFLETPTIYN